MYFFEDTNESGISSMKIEFKYILGIKIKHVPYFKILLKLKLFYL